MSLIFEQTLNGLQLGVTLFVIAAGLTLVFGIMNLLNLAHGSLYMVGAYLCASAVAITGNFVAAVSVSVVGTCLLAIVLERLVIRHFYSRDHLDQVIATFGLLIVFNELVRIVWGPISLFTTTPPSLSGQILIFSSFSYPSYRLMLITAGLLVAVLLWWIVAKTKFGVLIRASASQPGIMPALGVNTNLLSASVFVLGAAFAAFAGALTAPLYTVEAGMGDSLLIKSFVVLVIGGLGSVRGAFVAAILVGLVDTFGRLLPGMANVPAAFGDAAIYLLMIGVLYFRPSGLFNASASHA